MPEIKTIQWNQQVNDACRLIVQLAIDEDLAGQGDWTTLALVPADAEGAADVVARGSGIVAGMPAVATVIEVMSAQITAETVVQDGETVEEGATLLRLRGNVRDLLTLERTLLNLLSRLMGIATLTGEYVAKVADTTARVYDTRKTTPGWRSLEKYAARCGGACNHRMGLYDALLIKDNHLAQRGLAVSDVASAVRDARSFIDEREHLKQLVVEVEVDSLEQFQAVLPVDPDIVLLDNMSLEQLREAVALRNSEAPNIQLEASGGVNLQTIGEIAATGVERISVGAITHSACSLDIGLDWASESE